MSDSLSLSSRSDAESFNEDYDNKLKPLLLYESNDPIRSAYFLSEWQLNNEVKKLETMLQATEKQKKIVEVLKKSHKTIKEALD
uniref:Uncharacterized protein n=1 Tax=viral metagenome TaxID=1070528 RepID=A0A6C0L4N0_9ZZZZ|tara:strand:- start:2079 stop:2330 length:252 start_codon:yes stop_codon:yes gene_type:complete